MDFLKGDDNLAYFRSMMGVNNRKSLIQGQTHGAFGIKLFHFGCNLCIVKIKSQYIKIPQWICNLGYEEQTNVSSILIAKPIQIPYRYLS